VRRFMIVPVVAVAGLLLGGLTGCGGTEKPPEMQGGQKLDFHAAPVKPAGGAPAGGKAGGGSPGAI
jgi:hypothetical protein